MSPAARSILLFGIYIVIIGLLLVSVPNVLTATFSFPETQEPWIRVLGIVVTVLGLYYVQAGRNNIVAFFEWTVWGRGLVLLGLVGLVVFGLAGPMLIVFGVIDALGATWTALALRTSRRTTG